MLQEMNFRQGKFQSFQVLSIKTEHKQEGEARPIPTDCIIKYYVLFNYQESCYLLCPSHATPCCMLVHAIASHVHLEKV